MLKRFVGLGHEAVIRCHHKHGDVGDIGAAGAHFGESSVAGRIQECNLFVGVLDLVRADMLGDATGLTTGDVGLADGVEQ